MKSKKVIKLEKKLEKSEKERKEIDRELEKLDAIDKFNWKLKWET